MTSLLHNSIGSQGHNLALLYEIDVALQLLITFCLTCACPTHTHTHIFIYTHMYLHTYMSAWQTCRCVMGLYLKRTASCMEVCSMFFMCFAALQICCLSGRVDDIKVEVENTHTLSSQWKSCWEWNGKYCSVGQQSRFWPLTQKMLEVTHLNKLTASQNSFSWSLIICGGDHPHFTPFYSNGPLWYCRVVIKIFGQLETIF